MMINRTNDPLADRIEDIETKLRMLATSLTQAHRRLDEVTGRATPHPTVTAPEAPTYQTALGLVDAAGRQRFVNPLKGALQWLGNATNQETLYDDPAGPWAIIAAIARHESGVPIEPGRIDFDCKRTVWQVLLRFTEDGTSDQPAEADWLRLADDAFAALVQIVGDK